jgi:hypothetical protein
MTDFLSWCETAVSVAVALMYPYYRRMRGGFNEIGAFSQKPGAEVILARIAGRRRLILSRNV